MSTIYNPQKCRMSASECTCRRVRVPSHHAWFIFTCSCSQPERLSDVSADSWPIDSGSVPESDVESSSLPAQTATPHTASQAIAEGQLYAVAALLRLLLTPPPQKHTHTHTHTHTRTLSHANRHRSIRSTLTWKRAGAPSYRSTAAGCLRATSKTATCQSTEQHAQPLSSKQRFEQQATRIWVPRQPYPLLLTHASTPTDADNVARQQTPRHAQHTHMSLSSVRLPSVEPKE